MSHVPHELAEDFPEYADKIHDLKTSNAHFAKLADAYHHVNREIHRIESGVEPASDERNINLRKERMQLKDEINDLLKAAS